MAETFPKRLAIVTSQIEQLRVLWSAIIPVNSFYAKKFEAAGLSRKISTISQFTQDVPFTTKQEIVDDQRAVPLYGTNLTYPLDRYTRCHQTSGTTGQPLRWLDTAESWNWMLANWEHVHRLAGTARGDRVFFAFSFGPFLGFWLAFEAAARLGCLTLSGGGLSSVARLRAILDYGATVLCCTPSYAIHLAEVAAAEKIDLSTSQIRILNVAGEPGGSIASTRAQLKHLWRGARLYDHHGMTEVGPVTYECPVRPCVLHVMENAYVAEVINPTTSQAMSAGEVGELVLTTLGRLGSPLLRYRTGDLVRPALDTVCECGRSDLALEGGILGRTDDMVVVRGVNVYPSSIEEIVRACGGIAEYRVRISTEKALPEMSVQIEPEPGCPEMLSLVHKLEHAFEANLSLRVPVSMVASGTLPRFEMKARRWVKDPSLTTP